MTEPTAIRKTRTLAEIIRVSTGYMVSNAKVLLASLGVFAFPLILAGSLISYIVTEDRKSFSRVMQYKDFLSDDSFAFLIASLVVYLFGIFLFNLIINKHLASNESAGTEISFKGVQKSIGEDIRASIISFIFFLIIYFVVTKLLTYILLTANFLGGPHSNDFVGLIEYLMEIIVSIAPAFIIIPICLYFCITSLYVCYRDKIGATEGLKKVWGFTNSKPKKAILMSLVIMYMGFILYLMLQWAFYAIEFGLSMWLNYSPSLLKVMFVTGMLQTFFLGFIALFVQIAIILLYGSIEDEVDGYYLKNKIENI